jgi:hypothetical protein
MLGDWVFPDRSLGSQSLLPHAHVTITHTHGVSATTIQIHHLTRPFEKSLSLYLCDEGMAAKPIPLLFCSTLVGFNEEGCYLDRIVIRFLETQSKTLCHAN